MIGNCVLSYKNAPQGCAKVHSCIGNGENRRNLWENSRNYPKRDEPGCGRTVWETIKGEEEKIFVDKVYKDKIFFLNRKDLRYQTKS